MEWRNPVQILQNTKTYTHEAQALRFLLGGIGTGNISVDASGRLCDFEIFGHPDKDVKYPYNFFAVRCCLEGEEPDTRVLEAAPSGISTKALGHPSGELIGLPRFESSRFTSAYPFARVQFQQPDYPLYVTMEAYTPFIPLNSQDSGLPAFQVRYRMTNNSNKPAKVAVCGTMYNLCGFLSYDGYDKLLQDGHPWNEAFHENGLTGVRMGVSDMKEDSVGYGTMALATPEQGATVKPLWDMGGWFDGPEEFWEDFRQDGRIKPVPPSETVGSTIKASYQGRYIGSVAVEKKVQPGESIDFTFYWVWHFPNRYGWWPDGHCDPQDRTHQKIFQNYYAAVWPDAMSVLKYFFEHRDALYRHSHDFSDALYSSTLGADIVESLAMSITALRSNTCFRLADGAFYGWEGCFEHAGSCPGSCTHVWNYAQTAAFLFPDLERSMRRTEFLEETDEQGRMAFRAKRRLDGAPHDMLPAADGQLGSILRVWREWRMSGNKEFLLEIWEKVAAALDFAIHYWDPDGDGVPESQQHNTYDIEFYGPNPLTAILFYAALVAGARMAEALGYHEEATRWEKLAQEGSRRMDELLFNGEYYRQQISPDDLRQYRYQFGEGCLSDQLLGQELAHLYGLGDLLPKEHIQSALNAIWRYNFFPTLQRHESVQRGYAYQDEGGLVLCTWPKGGRPQYPFVYSDEIWSGIEHQVAVELIYAGMTERAIELERTIRTRLDGTRRSPYNEVECGNHYARSMAAWGLLPALSGFEFDLPGRQIRFAPRVNAEDFSCFYSCGSSWGVYHQRISGQGEKTFELIPLYGSIEGLSVNGEGVF